MIYRHIFRLIFLSFAKADQSNHGFSCSVNVFFFGFKFHLEFFILCVVDSNQIIIIEFLSIVGNDRLITLYWFGFLLIFSALTLLKCWCSPGV